MLVIQVIAILSAGILLIVLTARGKRRAATLKTVDPFTVESWPSLTEGLEAIAKWISPDRNDVLFLVKRRDGTFAAHALTHYTDEHADVWVPSDQSGIFDSETTALREMEATWPWMQAVEMIERTPNKAIEGTGE